MFNLLNVYLGPESSLHSNYEGQSGFQHMSAIYVVGCQTMKNLDLSVAESCRRYLLRHPYGWTQGAPKALMCSAKKRGLIILLP